MTITDQLGFTATSSVSVLVSFGVFGNSGDIGSPALAGSLSYNTSSGAYTVTAGGADIWDTSDQFRYTYAGSSGDGQITCRVTSISSGSSAWAKAGPMFRDSAAANAAYADVVATPGNGVSFQWRSSTGASCGFAQVTGVNAPVWLRLTRVGNQFSGYYSTNGTSWTQIGTTQTVTMATNALAGLAVTSHNASALTTAVMDNDFVSGTPTVATAASANPSTVVGNTTQLAVRGDDDGGETNLTYTWWMTSGPAAVTYSANGTNAAKTTVAMFTKAGSYTFLATITNASGLSTASSVSVTVAQTLKTVALAPSGSQFTVTGTDQFNNSLTPSSPFAWPANGITLARSDNSLHFYQTGTATDVTPLISAAALTAASVTGRDGVAEALTIDFGAGDLLPTAGGSIVFHGGTGGGNTLLVKGTTGEDSALLTAAQASLSGLTPIAYDNVSYFGFDLGTGTNALLIDHTPLIFDRDDAISAGTNVTVNGGVLNYKGHADAIGNLTVKNSGQVIGTAIHNTNTTVELGTLSAASITCDTLIIGASHLAAAPTALTAAATPANALAPPAAIAPADAAADAAGTGVSDVREQPVTPTAVAQDGLLVSSNTLSQAEKMPGATAPIVCQAVSASAAEAAVSPQPQNDVPYLPFSRPADAALSLEAGSHRGPASYFAGVSDSVFGGELEAARNKPSVRSPESLAAHSRAFQSLARDLGWDTTTEDESGGLSLDRHFRRQEELVKKAVDEIHAEVAGTIE